jgi:hypothetical protein
LCVCMFRKSKLAKMWLVAFSWNSKDVS